MDLAGIPLFQMLRGKLGYLAERQRLISENVANADTAGFQPRDLKAFNFQAQVAQASSGVTMAQASTPSGHMTLHRERRSGLGTAFKPVEIKDSETTLDGNSVVLEEQMMKMSQARMDYDAAISFYQKSLDILRMATRAPGRGA